MKHTCFYNDVVSFQNSRTAKHLASVHWGDIMAQRSHFDLGFNGGQKCTYDTCESDSDRLDLSN